MISGQNKIYSQIPTNRKKVHTPVSKRQYKKMRRQLKNDTPGACRASLGKHLLALLKFLLASTLLLKDIAKISNGLVVRDEKSGSKDLGSIPGGGCQTGICVQSKIQ